MKILAFGHRKRVGKDTSANFALSYLRANHPKISSVRFSFGDQVKIVSYSMFKWAGLKESIYYENNPDLKEVTLPLCKKSPREIWIEVGNMARSICPVVWCEMAGSGVKAEIGICPDLRDPSEIALIKRVGGFDIRIDREAAPVSSDPVDNALSDYHGWRASIANNGTLRELNIKVVNATKEFLNECF